jgi:acyl-CoA thioesterase-2
MHLFDHRQLSPAVQGFTGVCAAGYGSRIFGGHSLSHSLLAASSAIGHSRTASSLHAVFLSPGSAADPVLYLPSELKRGRAFDVVRVAASQGDRQILETLVSFHDAEPGLEFQEDPPAVVSFDALDDDPLHRYSRSDARAPFHCRTVPHDPRLPRMQTWIRAVDRLDEDPLQHRAALTYALDFLITKTAHNPIDGDGVQHRGASLDHTMWFHRPFRADEWLLVDVVATSFFGSRSLARASIFDLDGALVGSSSQEALLRHPLSGR